MGQTQGMGSSPLAKMQSLQGPPQNPAAQQNLMQLLTSMGQQGGATGVAGGVPTPQSSTGQQTPNLGGSLGNYGGGQRPPPYQPPGGALQGEYQTTGQQSGPVAGGMANLGALQTRYQDQMMRAPQGQQLLGGAVQGMQPMRGAAQGRPMGAPGAGPGGGKGPGGGAAQQNMRQQIGQLQGAPPPGAPGAGPGGAKGAGQNQAMMNRQIAQLR